MDDDDENPEDAILDDFKTIIDGLNEKLDLIGSQGQKMQNLVSSFSGFADNAKRLAERLIENRHEQFGDEELRKSLVSNVSDVCYEFFTQLKDGRPNQIYEQEEFATRDEAEIAREANLKKVEMVKEVNRLVLNLKHWSSTKYEAHAEGRARGDTFTPSWAINPTRTTHCGQISSAPSQTRRTRTFHGQTRQSGHAVTAQTCNASRPISTTLRRSITPTITYPGYCAQMQARTASERYSFKSVKRRG